MRALVRRAAALGSIAGIAAAAMADAATITVTTTADSGPGSLRQAILDANATADRDTIAFAIPWTQCGLTGVCPIRPASLLPEITAPVVIDGTTQPRYFLAPANVCATATAPSFMRVEVAIAAGTLDSVLVLAQSASQAPSTFRGLSVAGSTSIEIRSAGAHRVQCNHLGVNGAGTALLNENTQQHAVLLGYFADGVVIGTDGDGVDDVAERNVIAGWSNLVFANANSNNVIAGNSFGFAADGVTPLPCFSGVYLRQLSFGNRVGTNFDGVSDELERNVFGGCYAGVWLLEWENGEPNEVLGNWIGVDASGAPRGNDVGIRLGTWIGDGGADRIAYNRIEANDVGIGVEPDSPALLAAGSVGNCLADNGTGFLQRGVAAIAFEGNWWGAANGPSGLGSGAGDSVAVTGSGSVDFTPWETEGCPAPEPQALAAAIAALAPLAWLSARHRDDQRRRPH